MSTRLHPDPQFFTEVQTVRTEQVLRCFARTSHGGQCKRAASVDRWIQTLDLSFLTADVGRWLTPLCAQHDRYYREDHDA